MERLLGLFISILLISFTGCSPKNVMDIENIKEIWVYDSFISRGYTTAGAASEFQKMENDYSTHKFKLDTIFVESMKNKLLSSAKTRNTLQGKTGQKLLFAQFVMNDGHIRNIVLNSVGVVDYFVGHKLYYFVEESDKRFWMDNYYDRLIDMINSRSD